MEKRLKRKSTKEKAPKENIKSKKAKRAWGLASRLEYKGRKKI